MLDDAFIDQHTHGFDEFASAVRGYEWPELEKRSGLTRDRARSRGDGLCARRQSDRHLRHGSHAAPARGRDRAAADELAAAARQYRQARRRNLPGARPFQCAGPAHRWDHRKARTGAARQAGEAVRLQAATRQGPQHGRGLRGHPQGRGARVYRPRRQFRPRHPRARADGAGMAQIAADRADRHQAQPQPSDPWRGDLSPAVPRPHRGRTGRPPARNR